MRQSKRMLNDSFEAGQEPLDQGVDRRVEVGRVDDLADEAPAVCLLGAQHVAEQHQFLGAVQPDQQALKDQRQREALRDPLPNEAIAVRGR